MGEEIKIESSSDLADLEPQTTREYLMLIWPAQKLMLKKLEAMNGFKDDCEKRFTKLETSFTVGGLIVITAMLGLALKVVFGG